MWSYRLKRTQDSNGTWLVSCPAFPEVTTYGADQAECLRNGLAAIEEAIAARMADREAIPEPTRGRLQIVLPAQIVAKILLYRTMRQRGVSKNALARTLKWHRPQVDRLLNPRHATRMDTLEAAFGALGKRLKVGLDRAA
jgi:antitoxin HicB